MRPLLVKASSAGDISDNTSPIYSLSVGRASRLQGGEDRIAVGGAIDQATFVPPHLGHDDAIVGIARRRFAEQRIFHEVDVTRRSECSR